MVLEDLSNNPSRVNSVLSTPGDALPGSQGAPGVLISKMTLLGDVSEPRGVSETERLFGRAPAESPPRGKEAISDMLRFYFAFPGILLECYYDFTKSFLGSVEDFPRF